MSKPDENLPDPLESDTEITAEQVGGLMEYMEENMSSVHSHDLSRLFSFILFHYQINEAEAMAILMNAISIHMHYCKTEDQDQEENEVVIDDHDCSGQEEKTIH